MCIHVGVYFCVHVSFLMSSRTQAHSSACALGHEHALHMQQVCRLSCGLQLSLHAGMQETANMHAQHANAHRQVAVQPIRCILHDLYRWCCQAMHTTS